MPPCSMGGGFTSGVSPWPPRLNNQLLKRGEVFTKGAPGEEFAALPVTSSNKEGFERSEELPKIINMDPDP